MPVTSKESFTAKLGGIARHSIEREIYFTLRRRWCLLGRSLSSSYFSVDHCTAPITMALTPPPASASPSTSASAHSNYRYDVFLNHRGTDVKKTFASHLYRRLLSYGLQVFLDQPELRRGEKIDPQIEGAIATASVHVAIFSPGYAESRWCLDELVLMLKSGATVIPVFYKVKPSDLRWTDKPKDTDGVYPQGLAILLQMGRDRVYAEALLNLEKKGRYTQEKLAAWRKALYEVSHISGFELDACNGDEGELVDEVARQVQKKVRKETLHVAKHPTGLDEKLLEFETTLLSEQQHNREGPNIVGIVGSGGLGKTTLAKLFFNTKGSDYERSCFLPDVRDAAARHLLPSWQSKLYKDLTGSDRSIHSIDEGIPMFKHLSRSKALIILDDVDDVEQLDALFSPVKDGLPSGSLILLTSRNKDVLRISGGLEESSIYMMTGLNIEHSEQLFCSYAFHQPYPAAGYEELVKELLSACQGLPLSLIVIGALLYMGRPDLEYWEAQLRKLRNVLPADIKNRLRISYDSLEEHEKQIFLDIACFFIGIKKDTATRVWDGSDWEGSLGLRTLESKCLVTFDSENCIRMHDHLRDLGRELADKEPGGCPRRLWRSNGNLFRNVSVQSTVRGISMVQQKSGESFQSPADFTNHISKLQLLRAPVNCFESLLKVMRHPELLWLRCEIYDDSLASWISIQDSNSSLSSLIPLKNLRVLELLEVGSHVRRKSFPPEPIPTLGTLWNTESEAPLQLRELNIHVDLFHLPKSIGQLKYLEEIELRNFKGTLPEEFFHLRSLKHLRLTAGMKSFPESLGNFTNLQHIDLSSCKDLKMLPPSFGNLTKLRQVKLAECVKLKMLPDSFMNLIRLRDLDLSGCHNLRLSGKTLGNISTLERLNFSGCRRIKVLPPQVTHQLSLQQLMLEDTELNELPSAIGDLSNLEILSLGGPSLEALPQSFGKLTNLTTLAIASSPICQMPFASVENVQGDRGLLDSSIDKCMPRVTFLNLSNTRITEISFGEGVCPVLEYLSLAGCGDLVEVGALPTTLTSLNLSRCCALKKITGLGGLAKLKQLYMEGCKAIEELPGVAELNNLELLYLRECPLISTIVPFASVEKAQGGRRLLNPSIDRCMLRLQYLDLSKARITEISFGKGVCPVLESLNLSDCNDLVEVGALPTSLIGLALRDCCALKKIKGLHGLANLKYLSIEGCKAIEELPGLAELKNLESVQRGRRLLDSSIDNCMPRLTWLNLSKARITEISFGGGVCPALERLHLTDCKNLVEVGALPTSLEILDLFSCSALKKVKGLRGLAKLRSLGLGGCYAVEELPGLETLVSLETFVISECANMRRIVVLAEAANPRSDVLKRVISAIRKVQLWD